MSRLVVVVDYGMGNLRSVSQAVQHAAAGSGWTVEVSASPERVRQAERIVLPGQGAMPDCMAELAASGLRASVLEAAANKPLMGVCVGMQMLLDRSEEGPSDGLGLIPGEVVRFDLQGQLQADGSRYKVPQMGWNEVWPTQSHPMWADVPSGAHFYFVHSFFARPQSDSHVAAYTDYGVRFACAVCRDNVFATQFHPEKSAAHGLTLYRNFLRWVP